MDKLNYTFKDGNILNASELNAIVGNLNEITEVLSKIDNNDSSITDAQIQTKIDAALKAYDKLLLESIKKLLESVKNLEDAPEGASEVITEEEWALIRKKTENLEELVSAITLTYKGIDLTSLKEDVDKITKWASQLTIDPKKVSILVSLLDSNNELIINPASIIAAIVEDEDTGMLTSQISISSDRVILEGDVNLTDGLTAMRGNFTDMLNAASANIGNKADKTDLDNLVLTVNGKASINALETLLATVNGKASIEQLNAVQALIENLDVPSLATITLAIITNLTTLNLTITGTLHYDKIIANTTEVAYNETLNGTQLDDGMYFVKVTNTDSSNYLKLFLPANPDAGQTIFIDCGNRYFELKANRDIHYYRKVIVGTTAVIRTGDYTGGDDPGINARTWGWNGVVEFIYTGTYWQLLVHNIDINSI